MMLLEKCKDKEELKEIIIELYGNANTARREWLENLIKYVFPSVLNDSEILKLIKGKEKMPMEDLIERLKANRRREDRELKRKAISETIKSVITNMLKENHAEEMIMKITNAKKEEIEKIRQEMAKA